MARVKTIPLFSDSERTAQQPSNYTQRRALAEALMTDQPKRMWSTGEGLLSAGATMLGGFLSKKASDDEKREEDDAWAQIAKAITGTGLGDAPTPFASSSTATSDRNPLPSASSTPSGGRSGGGSRALASNERKSRLISRLVEKGYSQHAAEGVADNIADESAFNTRAVGDNGTAFGIAQWRGDRFKNLKAYAQAQGKDWQDFDLQTDFIDHEMRSGSDPQAREAYAKLQTAPDADSAYNAFVSHYERPSAANLQKRLRGTGQQMAQAPLDLSAYEEQARRGAALMRHPNGMVRRQGLQMIVQAQTAMQQARMKAAEFERESGLKYGLQDREDERMERQIELQAERDAKRIEYEAATRRHNTRPGSVLTDNNGNVVYENKNESGNGFALGYDEQGRPTIQMGKGAGAGMKLTEPQSKDLLYHDRAVAAMADLDPIEDELTSIPGNITEILPEGAQGLVQSEKYQLARNAGMAFLASILRKDSGAALTAYDTRTLGSIFLPLPGNGPAVIAQKRRYREVAVEALRKGLGPAAVLAAVRPDLYDGKSTIQKQDHAKNSGPDKYKPGYEEKGFVFQGGDPTDEKNWKKK